MKSRFLGKKKTKKLLELLSVIFSAIYLQKGNKIKTNFLFIAIFATFQKALNSIKRHGEKFSTKFKYFGANAESLRFSKRAHDATDYLVGKSYLNLKSDRNHVCTPNLFGITLRTVEL